MTFRDYDCDWKDLVYRSIDEVEAWVAGLNAQTREEAGVKKAYCELCGSNNLLEQHHIAGRKHDHRTITVCAPCHRKLSKEQKLWDKRWEKPDQSEDVRRAFYLQGLLIILRLKARKSGNSIYEILAYNYIEEISELLRRG